ncbi:hypothetical protein B1812_15660 [Methylocystis bryophila]|uniref:Uncharacterized protein n=1 Tax=Methylocystis bryophila TaxID=655015 RepID=A0A1W6MXP1_9HYPH|nr:hypothetical protein B1812_15660 [Methylocystis bryophila]
MIVAIQQGRGKQGATRFASSSRRSLNAGQSLRQDKLSSASRSRLALAFRDARSCDLPSAALTLTAFADVAKW